MAEWLQHVIAFFQNLGTFFTWGWFTDVLDILIVAFIIYEIFLLVRNTRIQQLVMGIFLLLLAFAGAALLNLRTLQYLLQAVTQFGIVVLAVIFQPELRRMLEQVGGVNSGLLRLLRGGRMEDSTRSQWEKAIVAICDAAENMAEERAGALIVLERSTNLVQIVRTGVAMHSDVNAEVLGTVFYKGSPLHDGAVVIRDGRIEAAGCFLPLSNNIEISKDMGTRHRAALGMSENSDAIVVVVSEETGVISLAKNAVLIRRLDRQNLFNLLISEIIPPEPAAEKENLFKKFIREVRSGKKD